MQSKFYYINTYGCQMNVHESEKIAGIFSELGYMPAVKEDDADAIVFNTCCIRETAETRFLGNLGNMKKLKQKKPGLIVAVCGCLPQRAGGKERVLRKYPDIDIVLGTHNLHLLKDYILNRSSKVVDIWEESATCGDDIKPYRTSGVNAWVNIMYGCNNFCSYCIVPYVRGRERSRSPQDIILDIKNLVSEGFKEITLLGQNVNSYASDIPEKNYGFAGLLEQIDQIDGKFRIRYMTSHPKDFEETIIKTIGSSEKIGRLVHLPAQSGSDRILKLMNRKYSVADYMKKVDLIRKYIPDAGISSDIIVGFPGETESDFMQTVDFIKKVRYNNLYTFIYSRRSGTVADKMAEQVDIKTKKSRISQIINEQFDIKSSLSAALVGKKFEVLCESHSDGFGYGKTSCGKIVKFKSNSDLTGNFVDILITGNKNSNLSGELTGE